MKIEEQSLIVYVYNLSTQEAEAGKSNKNQSLKPAWAT